jgi:hypothetical protein
MQSVTTYKESTAKHHFWTVPRATALVLFVVAVASFAFIVHRPYAGPTYSPAQDRASVLSVSGYVYDGVETQHRINALPIPLARTVADMRTAYRNGDRRVHVSAHGTNVMVTFPKEPAVCVWVPAITDGPKEPSIVTC